MTFDNIIIAEYHAVYCTHSGPILTLPLFKRVFESRISYGGRTDYFKQLKYFVPPGNFGKLKANVPKFTGLVVHDERSKRS